MPGTSRKSKIAETSTSGRDRSGRDRTGRDRTGRDRTGTARRSAVSKPISRSRFKAKSKEELFYMFQNKYSTRSDHLPVELELELELVSGTIRVKLLTYNTSFASDLGLLRPFGSERVFLSRMKKKYSKRHYMHKATALIEENFDDHSIIILQEINDADKIQYAEGVYGDDSFDVNKKFKGGYQAIIKTLANGKPVTRSSKIPVTNNPYNSYYETGSFGNHRYLAYSVEKILGNGTKIYPTVLTIWDADKLGDLENFYGRDLGQHNIYGSENSRFDNIHHGRPFSCVRTTKGVSIINMHGPNGTPATYKPDINKLRQAINEYIVEAKTQFGNVWNNKLTVAGGDLNDTTNDLKSINLGTHSLILKDGHTPPFTCCFEFMGERHKRFNKTGDIALVYRPLSKLKIVHADKSRQYSSDESSQGSPSSRGSPSSPKLMRTIMESEESDDSSMDGGKNYNNIKRDKKTRKFIKKRHVIHYKTKTSKN
jgi:hypothetical protein